MTENPTQSPPAGPPPGGPAPGPDPHYARPADGGSALDDVFGRLRGSGYARDTDARWFGGVCSGLARRWGVDPVLVRAIAVILAFFGGVGVTLYVVLWLVLPDTRGDILAERAVRRGDLGPVALLVVTALLLLGGFFSIGEGNGWLAPLWVVALVGVAVVLLRRDRVSGVRSPHVPAPAGATPPPPPPGAPMSAPTTSFAPPVPPVPYGGHPLPPAPARPVAPLPPPPPPRPRRRRPSWFVGLMSVGIALVGLGLGAALAEPMGYPGSAGTLGLLIGLTGVSLVVLALGLAGRASGFSGFLVVVLAFLLVGSAVASRVELEESSGFGPRTWRPVPASGETRFEHGGGDAVLDLSRFVGSEPALPDTQRISVEMGGGDLRILVPDGVTAQIDAEVGFGSIVQRAADGSTAPDNTGPDQQVSTTVGDGPAMVTVDAQLGVGQITIEEQ
ncbi:PspC domain-containing protein [Oryzobacter sp. R7]|uniref:PspC domain-containing protein n=1 Tax=Oryzobacter faecalis TaxID=3388656 RepID=UPI00398D2C5E